MADFNRKKLQVFVSSTFSDLKKERQAAVEAILTAGHIPAGMELFTAGDESQIEVIKQWIDESDVYLLILGARYGSIEPKTGKSYTHLEYEYALAQGKPLFACVIKDEAIDPRVKVEGRSILELENPQKLKDFRAEVLTRMSKFWDETKDIKITVSETLSQIARRENLVGWVRPSTQSNLPALADEIARLSKENAELRSQIANGSSQEEKINGLTFLELKGILEKENLLNFLLEHRDAFCNRSVHVDTGKEVGELGLRGLVQRFDGIGYFRITPGGRAFLNRLEAFQLTAVSPPPPPTSVPRAVP
jgi:hypothetical protein